ncbi:multifunctional CCA addition/repair protein [Pseudomonas japonica]|uniref:multifunctional CCA addition/repair protein n=1 Tax=Pseudomonas japonica TaxID=256466 RepID=UPI0015E35B14|nr:multifunctional CCA addition/repair protein [Pseudomonas japonica]MBA1287504.1 multifunctional CCA addition/repair protein [Pseudomonas japonica]
MKIYKVGGAVRDRLLGLPVADIDWVVVGASAEAMLALGYRPVGADFPVFLHPDTGAEYALARTERKSGRGYGGFVFHASPDVTLEDDLRRRDLTINAMAEDDDGHVIDPYGGQADLEQRWLRHVSPAFAEDPLRVLRVARFAARYAPLGFRVAPETLELMQQLSESGELEALTPERGWKEISRALLEATPEVFFDTLEACGALEVLFAEFSALPKPLRKLSLQALHQAAAEEHPLAVRWSALLLRLNTQAAAALSARFKVPRDCQELAQLAAEYHTQAEHAREMDAEALLQLLQAFDVYRRPQRFEGFLHACEMAARAEGKPSWPEGAYLHGAAAAARAVPVKPLVDAGHTGQALGEALKQARLAALSRPL